jgi:hypothetical protein
MLLRVGVSGIPRANPGGRGVLSTVLKFHEKILGPAIATVHATGAGRAESGFEPTAEATLGAGCVWTRSMAWR